MNALTALEEKRLMVNAYNRSVYARRKASDPTFMDRHRKRIRDYFNNTENGRRLRRDTQSRLRKESPLFNLANRVRVRISDALSGREKLGKSQELLGCSIEEYKTYLESMFKHGMSWNNFGKGDGCWSIDHKVPLAAHDLGTSEGQKSAFHYTNTEPSWHKDNLSKSSIYNGRRWYYRDHIKQEPEAAI